LVTKRTSPLARLLTLVTSLLAGVYYPIEVLPNWLQTASHLLPATFAFDALRRVMLQGESFANVSADLVALAIFTIILLPIGIGSFFFGLRWARIDGSLSEY
jgi:ABC-2 type transport system permease protein